MKRLAALVATAFVALWVSSACIPNQQPPPAQAPPIINNITPSDGGDGASGLLVMLAFAGIGCGVLVLVVAGLFVWCASERRARRDLEGVLEDLTGRDVSELTVMSARRRRVLAAVVSPEVQVALRPGSGVIRQ